MARSFIEVYFIEDINPLEDQLGYNRYKLWVGTTLFSFQFILKLLAANIVYDGYPRMFMIYVSLFNISYNIMRWQSYFVYRPFGKDFENLPRLIAFGGLLTANFMVILNANKKNLETVHEERKNGIRKDFELQTIMFNLEGAITIFKETSIRFINGMSEEIFNESVPHFKEYNENMHSLKETQSYSNEMNDYL